MSLHFWNHGQSHYEVETTIPAGDQLWLNLGDLIRGAVADKKGQTFPADLTSGTYDLRELNADGKPKLFEGKIIVDKTYGHLAYGCMLCCGVTGAGLLADPTLLQLYGSGSLSAVAYDGCDGTQYDETIKFSAWDTANHAIATMSGRAITGTGVGSTNAFAYARLPQTHRISCPTPQIRGQNTNNVIPTISGPNTVWWFNGQSPDNSNYPTSIVLTSSGGSSTTWSLSQPDNKVTLSTATGQSTTINPTGTYVSGLVGDVVVYANANGQTSAPFKITVRRPWKLVANYPAATNYDPTYTYVTELAYDLVDQFVVVMASPIDWNESVGACVSQNGSNWGSICIDTHPGSTGPLIDFLGGPKLSLNPSPQPVSHLPPTGTVPYEIVPQSIFVGSNVTGLGLFVQNDNLTYYIDQGKHTSILIPPAPPE